MWIPEETIEKVQNEANIVSVISQYVNLKKRGQNHFGQCPFHEDRTPSFSVKEEDQFFHCFSCGRGGNVFSFMMEMEGLSFPESVIKVAEMEDIPLDESLTSAIQGGQGASRKDPVHEVLTEAQRFYHRILTTSSVGQEAAAYLKDRGLTEETIEKFKLGYSPAQREALATFLESQDEDYRQVFEASGLFADREDGAFYDRFSERIIFPIADERGQVVGFSGRDFKDHEEEDEAFPRAKYLNSPDRPHFDKSRILYNLSNARPQIRRTGEAYLFEGYMDVIAADQAGVTNGLATMGTSLTDQHISVLDTVSDRVILVYDGDEAGQKATDRAISMLAAQNFDIAIVSLPDGMDPDDYVKKYGAEAFQKQLEHERLTPINFYMNYYRLGKNMETETDRVDYISQVLEKMTQVPSAVERDLYFTTLAEEFNLSKSALNEEFSQILNTKVKDQRREMKRQGEELTVQRGLAPQVRQSPVERAENYCLACIFKNPLESFASMERYGYNEASFVTEEAMQLLLIFQGYYDKVKDANLSNFYNHLEEEALKNRLVTIQGLLVSPDFSEEELQDCFIAIEIADIEDRLKKAQETMKQAKTQGNAEEELEAFNEILTLSQTKELSEAKLRNHKEALN